MEIEPALIDGSPSRLSGRRFSSERSETPCDVRLNLTADAERVVLVRAVVGSVAQTIGLCDADVHDVRLAVTEACTNVVRHAYGDTPGRLDVAASVAPDGLHVTITDEGCGLRPRVDRDAGGLGLPLMAALAARVEFGETDGRGTTVRLSFATAR